MHPNNAETLSFTRSATQLQSLEVALPDSDCHGTSRTPPQAESALAQRGRSCRGRLVGVRHKVAPVGKAVTRAGLRRSHESPCSPLEIDSASLRP